jgi:hypothetical protein
MRIAFLFVACLSFCTSAGIAETNYKVIYHEVEDGIGTYTVLIPASKFRKEVLLSMANRFLHRYAQINLLDIGIYTERASVYSFVGAREFDYSYEEWLHKFEVSKKRGLPCGAEIVKLGTSTGLRVRYTDGRIEEVPLSNGNVFHPVISGTRLDLLHVEIVRQGLEPFARLMPLVYFSASRDISPEEGAAIARSILRSSGASRIEMSFRPDRWFYGAYYPWVNPFAPVDSPQNEGAKRAWELLCRPMDEQLCYQVQEKR